MVEGVPNWTTTGSRTTFSEYAGRPRTGTSGDGSHPGAGSARSSCGSTVLPSPHSRSRPHLDLRVRPRRLLILLYHPPARTRPLEDLRHPVPSRRYSRLPTEWGHECEVFKCKMFNYFRGTRLTPVGEPYKTVGSYLDKGYTRLPTSLCVLGV